MIPIENWMSKPVTTVGPDETVYNALIKMVNKNIGDVIIVDKAKAPIGILTERDILKRVVAKDVDIKTVKVGDVMTSNIKTATTNMSLLEISRVMEKGKFRRIPIVRNNKVIGIVTSRDLVRFMSL